MEAWKAQARSGFSCEVSTDDFFRLYMGDKKAPQRKLDAMVFRGRGHLADAAEKMNNSLEIPVYVPWAKYCNALAEALPEAQRPFFDTTWATTFPRLHPTDPDSKPDVVGSKPGMKKERFRGQDKTGKETKVWSWPFVATATEHKGKKGDDPFTDKGPAESDEGCKAAVQLLHNARRMFMASGCCYVFLLTVFGHHARIVRVDHSGYIVTEPFDWTPDNEERVIPEFYWRLFCGGEPKSFLGADNTVSPTPFRKQAQMYKTLKKIAPSAGWTMDSLRSSLCITLKTGSTTKRCLTVGPPIHQSKGLFSRATRIYRVLVEGEEPPRLHALKDSWVQAHRVPEWVFYRIIDDHIENELGGRPVRGLTRCLGSQELNQMSVDHTTISAALREGGKPLQERHHQRTLLADVGTPIYEYPRTKVLLQGIRDAMEGHKIAVDAGIIHRDVSPGNLLLKEGPEESYEGFILDWDVSLLTEKGKAAAQRVCGIDLSQYELSKLEKEITGTFYFMAIEVLKEYSRYHGVNQPSVGALAVFSHEPKHDLESFFWVLIWVLLRYARHSANEGDLAASTLFDHNNASTAYRLKFAWLGEFMLGDHKNLISQNAPLSLAVYDLGYLYSKVHFQQWPGLTHDAAFIAVDDLLATEDGWPADDKPIPFDLPSSSQGEAETHERVPAAPVFAARTWAVGDPNSTSAYPPPPLIVHDDGSRFVAGPSRPSNRPPLSASATSKRKREIDDGEAPPEASGSKKSGGASLGTGDVGIASERKKQKTKE